MSNFTISMTAADSRDLSLASDLVVLMRAKKLTPAVLGQLRADMGKILITFEFAKIVAKPVSDEYATISTEITAIKLSANNHSKFKQLVTLMYDAGCVTDSELATIVDMLDMCKIDGEHYLHFNPIFLVDAVEA